MAKKKKNIYKKFFRKISHPRNNLTLNQDGVKYLELRSKPIPDVNHNAVYNELLNYFDIYDVGLDIGNKEIRHVPKRDELNKIFFQGWNKKPKNFDADYFDIKSWHDSITNKNKRVKDTKLNADKIYQHITKQKKWYYTTNPFCQIRSLGSDVDNKTADPSRVLPFLELLKTHYPDTFYDNGSSGKSLHYYPLIDMLLLYQYFIKNTSNPKEWAKYANTVIRLTGKIFNIFGRNILCPEHKLVLKTRKNGKTKLVPEYFVEFDAFKGTYPQYDFDINKDGSVYIKKMIKSGVLHKIPNIFTVDDLVTFRDSTVYSIIHHLSVSMYLCYQVLLSGCFSDKDYKILQLAMKVIEPVLEAHNVLLPSQAKNLTSLDDSLLNDRGEEEVIKKLCIYNGTFEDVDDIALENDAMIRSRRYLYYCFMEYIVNEGREPTEQEYIKDYRLEVGTGEETEENVNRLKYVYQTNIEKMRKYAFGTLSQKIDQMENNLKITQEEIDKSHSYKRKIWKREVAIAALWIEFCLTNQDYISKKTWWSIGRHEHFSRELTVPANSLENFIEKLNEKNLCKNGCKDNHSKAKALRDILEKIGWMQCVDDTVVIAAHNENKEGRSRRYILLPDHPNYKKFENIVGIERIKYWQEFREKQLRERNLKQTSKKVG